MVIIHENITKMKQKIKASLYTILTFAGFLGIIKICSMISEKYPVFFPIVLTVILVIIMIYSVYQIILEEITSK